MHDDAQRLWVFSGLLILLCIGRDICASPCIHLKHSAALQGLINNDAIEACISQ